MAKKKKRKSNKEQNTHMSELLGIALVLVSILGIGRYGLVGKLVSSFAVFLTGVGYNILLIILLILGGYIVVKREQPKYFNSKLIGLYITAVGILILCHFKYITNYNQEAALIFSKTLDELLACFNNIMSSGLVNITGGGLIGCTFGVLFNLLFALEGTRIVSIVLIVAGLCMFTGFSIFDVVKNTIQKTKNIHLPTRIHDTNEEEEDDEDEVEEKTQKKLEKKTKIVISSAEEVERIPIDEQVKNEVQPIIKNNNYQLPPLTLLNPPKKKQKGTDSATIEKNIQILERVLKDFKIVGKVVEVHIGPTVAQYELEIASGTRVNKITSINREIALALAKKDVRIEAPIPGKNTVGIEFANEVATPVSFYEIISSKLMTSQMDKKLMIPLGKSIMGDIGVCEINKMPHMLIAGTTGSGKSVCVNGIICSILMRARPDEVKLVMVDPKVVELSVYNGIPHLLCPVVSDPKKASTALAKMVQEMENRYSTFSETKTKSIETYNAYVEKWNEKHSDDEKKAKMPYIVVIIDELADLMMVAAKEVEDSILRITQKARAAGIHLIVATQRPSTEVITGLIKANIPSRIAFTVGSGIDSRTILDMTGAEKLLGKGDMLYLPIGSNAPTRIQGSFITDEEIGRIIDFTIQQQKAQYDQSLMNLQPIDTSQSTVGKYDNDEYDDPLYNDIVDFVVEQKKASTSLIQRRFKLGYNRAARIVDLLEERGVVGPQNGSKPREVLIGKENEEDV